VSSENQSTRKLRVQSDPSEPNAHVPEPKQGSWYLLTGLVLGLAFGLVYAWLVNPAIYQHVTPASLAPTFKDSYRSLIAQTYAATGNLERATHRLALLEDPNPVFALGAQAQQALADGQAEEAHALALLASALQGDATMEAGPIPTATLPPVPTRTLPINTPTP
jgi:hypothetical protein